MTEHTPLHLTELRYRPGTGPTDTQATHRTILHVLGTSTPGRVLWCQPTRDLLIVQAAVPVRAGAVGGVVESHSGPVRLDWPTGTPVTLTLIANPVWSPPAPKGQRGARLPLPIDQHADWLTRKLDGAVHLDDIAVQPIGTRTGRRHEMRVAHRLSAFAATGTVTDGHALGGLIRNGVGPGKAYGAGLLLVVAR